MLPNFLLLGAMKAGTTALHHSLSQHPQIYMSTIKEPHFFSYEGKVTHVSTIVTSIDAYQKLFEGVTTEIAYGESSPAYLADDEAPARIKHYIPHVKMIAILRDPVDRAYSNFWHERQQGREQETDFLSAFEKNHQQRLQSGQLWGSYRVRGLYYQQLTRYYQTFDKQQLRVYLYEDWNTQPAGVLRAVFTFLGVDPGFEPQNERYTRSGKPKIQALYKLLKHPPAPLRRMVRLLVPERLKAKRQSLYHSLVNQMIEKPPPITQHEREVVLAVYHDEILALQDLIQRDLSAWLRVEPRA
ncbi:MAG: sulfotransferase domain-containing protein [Chloroflexota bacterium]